MNDEELRRLGRLMNQAVTPMLEKISYDMGKIANEYISTIQPQLDKVFNQIIQSWHPQLDEIFRKFDAMLKAAEIDSTIVAPILAKSNLWITPSMPYDLILKVKELANSNDIKVESVERIFLEYFEENDWVMLHEMIKSWETSHPFAQRRHIIYDAFDAHKSGKYTLSIPTLLTQVEGVLSSITGKKGGKPYKLFEETIRQQYPDILNNVTKDILLEFATSLFLYKGIESEHFTTDKLPLWLESKGIREIDFMNRHAILHGIHINYASKINSLRVFLLLDSLHSLTDDENFANDA